MTRRGDVVLVLFPFSDGKQSKKRPALVVQCDRNNERLQDTIIAMITGNIERARKEPTQLLIDPQKPSGKHSGLHGPSAVKCERLYTIWQRDILRTIGRLPKSVMNRVNSCLKVSLGL